MISTKNPMQKLGVIIMLSGLMWGLLEATLGWFLHFFHLHGFTPTLIVAGVTCMSYAIIKTGKPYAAFLTAVTAALIKSTNLLIAVGTPAYWILKPMAHIVGEGLIMACIASVVMYFAHLANGQGVRTILMQRRK